MWWRFFRAEKKDDLLKQAWDECYHALEIAREMHEEAVALLRNGTDGAASQAIRKKDKQINEYQRDIRRKVLTHCTLQGVPHIIGGMLLVSIIIDIERIGDNVKNILDLADALETGFPITPQADQLVQVEADVAAQFTHIVDILKNYEIGGAREIIQRHREETRLLCDSMIEDLVKGRVTPITPQESAALALYLRYQKRISAHLKNVATSVVNPFDRIGFKEKGSQSI